MIYEAVAADVPIRQGDIFVDIPKVEISLSTLIVVEEDDQARETSWRDTLAEAGSREGVAAVLPVKPVKGIVITQNCDAVRSESLVLSQVDTYQSMIGASTPTKPRSWARKITQQARENLRYFYLPCDPSIGFSERMGCDYRVLVRSPRRDLEEMIDLRVGRLNEVATEHFRESLAQFFRRYPYNEWYPLTPEEFEAYEADSPEAVDRYPWQR